MKQAIVFILILTLTFYGCNIQTPTEKDVPGTWVSKDGAILKFYEDYTFELVNLKGYETISGLEPFPSEDIEIFNGKGHWRLKNAQGWQIIYLNFKYDIPERRNFSTEVRITGKRLLGYKPPWYIFFWIGDPDQENRCIFEKVEQTCL